MGSLGFATTCSRSGERYRPSPTKLVFSYEFSLCSFAEDKHSECCASPVAACTSTGSSVLGDCSYSMLLQRHRPHFSSFHSTCNDFRDGSYFAGLGKCVGIRSLVCTCEAGHCMATYHRPRENYEIHCDGHYLGTEEPAKIPLRVFPEQIQ